MTDFSQGSAITTLHKLGDRSLGDLEYELIQFSRRRPMALLLPCLYSELEGPAMGPIVEKLAKIPYLNEIVIGLDAADEAQFAHAKEFFAKLPQPHRVLWNDGPRLQKLHSELSERGLAPTERGKGYNVWYCLGYLRAANRSHAIAIHDCDIVTYERDMLARLFYPIVHPNFTFKFAKGYYARINEGKLRGRVTRLYVAPLLKAMQDVIGPLDYLDYMSSFRYPLSGEFAMSSGVAERIRIPSDWGLEVGVLSEVHRRYGTNSICQVDIADVYDHKHQDLSPDDANQGLHRMTVDIGKAIYRKLATHGVVLSEETIRTIKAAYLRIALDYVERYYCDAQLNGLTFDTDAEERAVEVFVESIIEAGEQFLQNPKEVPFIPSWNRVVSAVPDFYPRLLEAVEADS